MKKVKYYFSIVLILCIMIELLPVKAHAASEIVTSHAMEVQEMFSEKSEAIAEGIAEIKAGFEAKKGWFDDLIAMIKDWFHNLWRGIWSADKVCTITFMYNYGDKEAYKVMTVNEGESVYPGTAPSRSGYIFEGWFIDKSGEIEYDFSAEITDDVELFAKWTDHSTKELWLSASREILLTNEDDTIRFYVDTKIVTDVIYLYDISSERQCVAEMYDDGLFDEHGDDMAGDGIYSAVVTEAVWEDKVVSYVAECGSESSNVVDIEYYTPVSDSTLEAMKAADEKIIDLVNSVQFEKLSDKEKKNCADDLLKELIENDLIMEDTICYNEEKKLYSFEYAEGILGGILLEEFDSDFNGNVFDAAFNTLSNNAAMNIPLTDYMDGDVGNAIILNSFPSFETEEEDIGFRTDFYEDLKEGWDNKGLLTTLDTEVTVSDYKNLKGYDVVCISTHGSTYEWNDGFLWLQHHQYPAICLSEKVTWEKNKLYSLELKDKQIVKVNGCYWLLPTFFENTYDADDLSGTFIFAECCQFMGRNGNYDYSMSEAFLSRSVPAVVGFHNSVYAVYSREFMETYVNSLIEGEYVSDAYDTGKSNNGANHKVWYEGIYGAYDVKVPVAYPVLSGDREATLIQTGIINGDFELYDFASTVPKNWSTEGDVRTISQLGDVKAADTSSKRMSIITTGVGSKTTATVGAGTEGSSISQRFFVPEDATTLSFDYNFISEEPMEYVGSEFNDSFGILIKQKDIIRDEYTYESINSSLWYEVKNIDFDGGDDTVYQTGWKNAEVDISAYRGKIITFYFVIYDVGDSIYDSACVIDNVALK